MKVQIKTSPFILPLPAVLVGTYGDNNTPNAITDFVMPRNIAHVAPKSHPFATHFVARAISPRPYRHRTVAVSKTRPKSHVSCVDRRNAAGLLLSVVANA